MNDQIQNHKLDVQVLLATYNGAKYLSELLDSLVNQVNVDVHLLVSDDGSVDDTLKLLETFRSKFQSVTIFEGPKLGAAENFASLIQRAQGRYVAYADQDDIWMPTKLIKAVRSLESCSDPTLYIGSSVTSTGLNMNSKPFELPL